nr:MAG TPA: Minor capsid protein [Caudoviricetes sp.]
MLEPIPRRMLTDTLELHVPSGIDVYQNLTEKTYTVSGVHLQNTNETRKTTENTEVVLRSVLFVDGRLSQPVYDYVSFQTLAHIAGRYMTCYVTDKRGGRTGPYSILSVDALPDDAGNIHHYELGLV